MQWSGVAVYFLLIIWLGRIDSCRIVVVDYRGWYTCARDIE